MPSAIKNLKKLDFVTSTKILLESLTDKPNLKSGYIEANLTIPNRGTYLIDKQNKEIIFATPLNTVNVSIYLSALQEKLGEADDLDNYHLILPVIGNGITEQHIVTLYKPKGDSNKAFVIDSKTSDPDFFFKFSTQTFSQRFSGACKGIFRALIPNYQKTISPENIYFESVDYLSTGYQSYFDGVSCGYHTLSTILKLVSIIEKETKKSQSLIRQKLQTLFKEDPLDSLTLELFVRILSAIDFNKPTDEKFVDICKQEAKKQILGSDDKFITFCENILKKLPAEEMLCPLNSSIKEHLKKVLLDIKVEVDALTFEVLCFEVQHYHINRNQTFSLKNIRSDIDQLIEQSIDQSPLKAIKENFFLSNNSEEKVPAHEALRSPLTSTSNDPLIKKNLPRTLIEIIYSEKEHTYFLHYRDYIASAWNKTFFNGIDEKTREKQKFQHIVFGWPLENRLSHQIIYFLSLTFILHPLQLLLNLIITLPVNLLTETFQYWQDSVFLAENKTSITQYARSALLLLIYPLLGLSKTLSFITTQLFSLLTPFTKIQRVKESKLSTKTTLLNKEEAAFDKIENDNYFLIEKASPKIRSIEQKNVLDPLQEEYKTESQVSINQRPKATSSSDATLLTKHGVYGNHHSQPSSEEPFSDSHKQEQTLRC